MDTDDIWAQADLANEMNETETDTEEIDTGCKHEHTEHDHKTSDNVCTTCGVIVSVSIFSGPEWNNYKDESGNYSKNTQRSDMYQTDNPYQENHCCIIQFKNNPFLMRLQYQQAFSHKQKTFWKTGLLLESAASRMNLTADCLDSAKGLWHKCMESGKLTRASVREGLIASCLYYSCVHNHVPIERDEIMRVFCCTSKCLSKGEKVICQILEMFPEYHHLIYDNVHIDDNDSFIKYCSHLKLPFGVSTVCIDVFKEHELKLQAVTPKSATGGVIAYVVKDKLKYKTPTKAQISKIVDVCTPTINKVIDLIKS
jgi:transcription initiation factor TFIIIB Brf1 subunit/transcription initiation factor TFIIB